MLEVCIFYIDICDIVDMVIEVLLDDFFNGKMFIVIGLKKLIFVEVVEIISDKLGRKIQYQFIIMEEFKIGLEVVGFLGFVIWLLSYLFIEVLGYFEN